ncbi:MAG TPA: DUF6492 family protein [Anaeromyxobacteraceae bacterium]|nr:DUF6492 family protein [Anaeromyxobacteraceae bacterium]
MPHVAIVTPSFLPDLERCELLAEGVARFASPEHRHVVIVPRADLPAFRERIERHGAMVIPEEDLLPSWLLRLPLTRKWQLTPRGWPVRGWIRQQVVKIAFGCLSTADVLLFVDSDTCVVRPFDASLMLRADGRVKLLADGEGNTPRHRPWYHRAGRLLGIPVKDYYGHGFIGNLVPWVPEHVRGMVRRIEEVSGGDWKTLLLHQKTISEYVLYGVYVEEVLGLEASRHVAEATRPVIEYWEGNDLSNERLLEFVGTLASDQIAIHVQSKVPYSFEFLARTVRGLWEQAEAGRRGASATR